MSKHFLRVSGQSVLRVSQTFCKTQSAVLSLLIISVFFFISKSEALEKTNNLNERKMIEIELPDILTGETLKLSDYKGHVIYLDFWASWCQPCRTSMPVMELMQAEFSEEKFKVFAVNLDDERKLGIEMMNELSVTFTNVWDEKKRMPDAYEIPGMPSAYLIDKQGNIRLVHKGFKKSDTEKIKRAISILLHEKERE